MIDDIIEKERKLRKVLMEYNNGDKEYIEGEEAEIWIKALNSALTCDFIHGGETQNMLKTVIWKKL